jgi:hypothetical protein
VVVSSGAGGVFDRSIMSVGLSSSISVAAAAGDSGASTGVLAGERPAEPSLATLSASAFFHHTPCKVF